MIPEKLKISGLYSYQTAQSIDFQKLLQDGIFGIFGNVGSGKSSILEAMTLALYNRIERMSSNENRNYNLMNLKSDRLEIDFEFRVGENHYRIEVRGKRNSKRFSDVQAYHNTTFIRKNGEWEVTKESIEDIIGLSYDNFKRTIIIPQGKFLEFLQLSPTERTEMLQKLFGLDKYDLIEKVNFQKDRIAEKLNQLKGNLQEIGEIKEEDLNTTVSELNQLEEKIYYIKKEIIEYENKIKELERLEISLNKIKNWEKELEELEKKKPEMEELKKKWKEYKSCKERFGEKIRDLEKLEQESLLEKAEIIKTKGELEALVSREKQVLTGYEKAKEDYQKKDEYIKKSEGWKKAKEYFKEKENQNKFLIDAKQIESESNHLQKQIQISKDKKLDIDKQLSEKQKLLEEQESFLEGINSLREKMNLLREWEDLGKKKEKQIEEKRKLENQIVKKVESLYNQSLSFEQLEAFFQERERQIHEKEQDRKRFEFQMQLKELSTSLKIGEECPICGEKIKSLDHINKYNKEDMNSLDDLEKEIKSLNNMRNDFQIAGSLIRKNQHDSLEIEKLMDGYKNSLPSESERNEYGKLNDYTNNYKKMRDEKKVLETSWKNLLERLELEQQEFNKKEQEKNRISLALSAVDARLDVIKKEISEEILSKAKDMNLAGMEERILTQEKYISDIEKNFETKTKEFQEYEHSKHLLQAKWEEKTKRQKKLEENEDRLKEELKLELKKKPSFELEDVKNILNYNINEIETLEKINHYYKDIEQTSKLIENEKANIDSQSVLVEEKDSILEKLNTNNKELQILNERIGELKSKKQVLEEGLKRKRELESEREALENKKDRVETLKKLFEKKGFVNYVSTLYLEDLCESANERFFVFTSNRLRLELNEKNEIHVRDLYHDGNYRHIKTLSGGQLFQASLAMALALSDRIQTASGVSERFFFLDEGFGSLDKESLAVVFETLKSLRKENRIVGLISHVEEMKSEIRTYLSVTNRPGMGTSVRGNWERTGN